MTDDATKQPKRKRRWMRFSLRSFLIVVTILCVFIGWYVYRVDQQKKAVRWVLKHGGAIRYDYQVDSDGRLLDDSQPPGPKWLHSILGVDYFASVVTVNFTFTSVSDLTPLASLTNLEWLYLDVTPVNDLTPLSGLKNLNVITRIENTHTHVF